MEDELKLLQDEMKKLNEELRQTQFKLQLLYNRVQQMQSKKTTLVSSPAARREMPSLENFIGLKLIHIVGIIVLVIGISIGVKYAIDRELITELARIGLAYAAGAILYALSWRLRKKYAAFSAILFSGAMASLYFTTYAAFVYYGLFSFAIAFAAMIVLTLFTTYQALQYNREEIALLGLVGAYGIPFLISANTGNVALLFTYILLINTAVVYLSYRKNWKTVMVVAQVISWLLFLGWGSTRYIPDDRSTGLIFATAFFVLFLFHAILPKVGNRTPTASINAVQVLLNNLVFYIALQVIFTPKTSGTPLPVVTAVACLLAAVQAIVFYLLFRDEKRLHQLLVLFSVALLLLFIAGQWDGLVVTLLWLAVAVGLFVAGVWQKSTWLRLSSIILMGITLLKLLLVDSLRFNTIQKIISYISLGILLLVVSFFYQKFRDKLFAEEGEGRREW